MTNIYNMSILFLLFLFVFDTSRCSSFVIYDQNYLITSISFCKTSINSLSSCMFNITFYCINGSSFVPWHGCILLDFSFFEHNSTHFYIHKRCIRCISRFFNNLIVSLFLNVLYASSYLYYVFITIEDFSSKPTPA